MSFYAFDRIFMHMFQITFHLFWDDFSLRSILLLPYLPYPRVTFLLTDAQSNVNMQYPTPMIPTTFSFISHSILPSNLSTSSPL